MNKKEMIERALNITNTKVNNIKFAFDEEHKEKLKEEALLSIRLCYDVELLTEEQYDDFEKEIKKEEYMNYWEID